MITPRGWVVIFIALVLVGTALYHVMHESERAELKRHEAKLAERGFRYVILPPNLTMHHEWEGCLMVDDVVLRIVKAPTRLGVMRKLASDLPALEGVPV